MHYLFVRNLPVLPAEKEFALTFFSGILPFVVERSETEKGKIPLRRRRQPAQCASR
jgi:hypothetical protein